MSNERLVKLYIHTSIVSVLYTVADLTVVVKSANGRCDLHATFRSVTPTILTFLPLKVDANIFMLSCIVKNSIRYTNLCIYIYT